MLNISSIKDLSHLPLRQVRLFYLYLLKTCWKLPTHYVKHNLKLTCMGMVYMHCICMYAYTANSKHGTIEA